MDNFICISINFKYCDEELRGHFAFPNNKKERLVRENEELYPVLLCTCNRTELYYIGKEARGISILSELSGISESVLKQKVMMFRGERAVVHLFRVACGIDSMVIGEDEILGQVKSAYAFSMERQKLSNEINIIFQSAVAAAKKIKTETELSRSSVSTATLAAKLAAHSASHLSSNFPKVKTLLIGATGKIGGKVLKNLLSYKNVSVIATARSHNGKLNIHSDNPALVIIPYEKRYDFVSCCDCVISATASPHFTLIADKLTTLSDGKKHMFIDLAVPRDVDPKIAEQSGVTLYDIDYFSELAKENNEKKLSGVEQANSIIEAEIDELKKRLLLQEFMSEFDVSKQLSGISAEELFYKLKNKMSSAAFSEVIEVVKGEL